MARSPATAIAIIKELRCKGKMTTTFLSITVLSDVFVLIAVTLTVSFCKSGKIHLENCRDMVKLYHCEFIVSEFRIVLMKTAQTNSSVYSHNSVPLSSACSGVEFKGENVGIVLAMIVVSLLLGIVVGLFYMLLMRSSRFIIKVIKVPAIFFFEGELKPQH